MYGTGNLSDFLPIIQELLEKGLTLQAIAEELTAQGHVRQTLDNGHPEDVVQELCDLGLMEFVRDFLPQSFRK